MDTHLAACILLFLTDGVQCIGMLAQRALANVIGDINDVEFGVAEIHANITRLTSETRVSAVVHQIPSHLGNYLRRRRKFMF